MRNWLGVGAVAATVCVFVAPAAAEGDTQSGSASVTQKPSLSMAEALATCEAVSRADTQLLATQERGGKQNDDGIWAKVKPKKPDDPPRWLLPKKCAPACWTTELNEIRGFCRGTLETPPKDYPSKDDPETWRDLAELSKLQAETLLDKYFGLLEVEPDSVSKSSAKTLLRTNLRQFQLRSSRVAAGVDRGLTFPGLEASVIGAGLAQFLEKRAKAELALYFAQRMQEDVCVDGTDSAMLLATTCSLINGTLNGTLGVSLQQVEAGLAEDAADAPARLAEILSRDRGPNGAKLDPTLHFRRCPAPC